MQNTETANEVRTTIDRLRAEFATAKTSKARVAISEELDFWIGKAAALTVTERMAAA